MRVSSLYQKITNESLNKLRDSYRSKVSTVNSELSRITSNFNPNTEFSELKSTLYDHKDELPLLSLFLL